MTKLINLIHPYEVNSIKNLNDFFIILKNLLRLSSKRIIEKKDGILIPVRWSIKKKCWVVDRGTDLHRDIEGIDNSNLDYYFKNKDEIRKAIMFTLKELNNKNLDKLLESYNLKKNENKFFAFEYCNMITNIVDNKRECLYTIGLFQRCQTKKRSGVYSKNNKSILIDNSIETLEKVSSFNKNIFSINSYRIKNYLEAFNSFYSEIKNKKYTFLLKQENLELKVIDLLSLPLSNKTSHKEILSFISNNSSLNKNMFNKIKINVILYLVYFDFVKFIKNYLNIKKENFEGFIIPDNQNNIYYKVTGEFVLKVFTKNNVLCKKELLPPLIPGVF